jgi:hypothetical protein
MNKKDEEIQKKLEELELSIEREQTAKRNVPAPTDKSSSPQLITTSTTGSVREVAPGGSDLHYFGGIALVLLSLVQMFQHAKVGTGILNMFGMGGGGFGLLLIPLMIGIGWLMYDPKSKIPWLLTVGVCALIILSILGSLILSFPTLSVMDLIIMLLPMAIGAALLLRGAGGPKAIEDKIKRLR